MAAKKTHGPCPIPSSHLRARGCSGDDNDSSKSSSGGGNDGAERSVPSGRNSMLYAPCSVLRVNRQHAAPIRTQARHYKTRCTDFHVAPHKKPLQPITCYTPRAAFHKRPEYRFSHLPLATTMVDRLQNRPTGEPPRHPPHPQWQLWKRQDQIQAN